MTEDGRTRATSPTGTPRRARRARFLWGAVVTVVVLLGAFAALRALAPAHVFSTRALVEIAAVAAAAYVALVSGIAVVVGGPWRRLAGRVALATAAGACVVVALELPALLFDFDWRLVLTRQDEAFFGRIKPWKNPWNVVDEELVFRRPPDSHVVGRARGDCVSWLGIANAPEHEYDLFYDARGYRNAGVAGVPTLTAATIAVIGDSFIEAAFVPFEDVITTRIGRALGVPVVNLGVGGYGPQQELVVLRRDALPLRPRVVFWCFFEGNDLNDARRFARDESAEELDFRHRSFTTNSAGVIARAVARPMREDEPEARRSCGTLRVAGADDGAKLYFPYPARPLGVNDEAALALVTQLLHEAVESCRAADARLVLVFVPEKFRVYRPFCEFRDGTYPPAWKLSDLPERLAAWAHGAGVGFVDLTVPLQAAAAREGLVYFADDGHWNARGHAAAADALAEYARGQLVAEAKR